MATAEQKYKKKKDKLEKKMQRVADVQSKIKTNHGQIIQYFDLSKKKRKAFDLQNKKYNRLQNQLNKIRNGSSAANRAARKGDWAQATKDNVKNHEDYHKFSYLRVNNPHSAHSYVYLFVQSEAPTFSNNISNEATEHGVNRMTNTQMQPTSISVSGIIYNKADGLEPIKKVVNKIKGWTDNGVEMCYSGAQFYRRCIITSFNPTFNTNGDGSTNTVSFSMDIQAAMYFNDEVHKSSKSVKHSGSKGRKKGSESGRKYVVAKRGDTYGRIARKKGVALSTVKSMNSGSVTAGKRIYY